MNRMSLLLRVSASAASGYLMGTIPSAKITALVFAPPGTDVAQQGSGNPGAANAASVMGKKAGATVLGADMAKATIASVAGRQIAGLAGGHIAGTAAVIGHCYPVWSRFRHGGKGVACSAGQMLATFPAYLPVDIALGVVMAKGHWWRNHKTESTAMVCGLWVALGHLWNRRQLPNLWGGRPTVGLPLAAAASSAVILRRFLAEPPPKVDQCRSH